MEDFLRELRVRALVGATLLTVACAGRSTPPPPDDLAGADPIATVLVVEAYGRAEEPELLSIPALTNEVFACAVHEDCVLVELACGERSAMSVNRAHARAVAARYQGAQCEQQTAPAAERCPDGECAVQRVPLCDGSMCARLETRSIGDVASELTLVHNTFAPLSPTLPDEP